MGFKSHAKPQSLQQPSPSQNKKRRKIKNPVQRYCPIQSRRELSDIYKSESAKENINHTRSRKNNIHILLSIA